MNITKFVKTGIFRDVVSTKNVFSYSKRFIAYRSAVSLDKLYPESNLKLVTPSKPNTSQHEDFDGFIPIKDLNITYSRSSGPGGQNVNKVNTKVEVRFHLESAKWLSDKAKQKLFEKFNSKLSKDGHMIFRSDITRSQQLNLADCLEKIRSCVRNSLQEPAEPSIESQERIRKRLEKANIERLAFKRNRSMIKAYRRGPELQL